MRCRQAKETDMTGRMMGLAMAMVVLTGCAGPMTLPGGRPGVGAVGLPSVSKSEPTMAPPCQTENWPAYLQRLRQQPDLFVGPDVQDHLRAMFKHAAGGDSGSLTLKTFPLIVDPNPEFCVSEGVRRQRLFTLVDADRNGRVTVNEFTHPDFLQFVVKGRMMGEQSEFTRMDKDGNRFLALSEWVFPGSYLPGPDAGTFRQADSDRDGRVSLYEFACYRASTGPVGVSYQCITGCDEPTTPIGTASLRTRSAAKRPVAR
jgi:hypothetical protein